MKEKLENYVKTYLNNEDINNQIYDNFTNRTDSIAYLKNHRDFIESKNLGFGDRAFTYMWFLILNYVKDKNLNGNLLEIGVFKGQIISLWSLISKQIDLDSNIIGITPLKGTIAKPSFVRAIRCHLSKKYRKKVTSLNHYENLDYLQIIRSLAIYLFKSLEMINQSF